VGDDEAFAAALTTLAQDRELRKALGNANRALAVRDYDEAAMIASYRALYGLT
jgi:glycosyltransferase involved in cell wall biosynthesis